MREHVFPIFFTPRNSTFRYRRKIRNLMIGTILLLITTVAVNIGLLYLLDMLWYIYTSTPAGQRFVTMSTETLQVILDILRFDSVSLSIDVTLAAFTICLLISAICQVFYIARFLYLPRNFFGKIAMWGLPLAAAVATRIQQIYEFEDWITAYIVALIPTLCVFGGCFRITGELLPELGDLVRKVSVINNQFIKSLQTKEANKEANRID